MVSEPVLEPGRMKIKHMRWYVAALLFTSTVINYVDRQTLSVLAPVLTRELHLTDREYAAILQAFLYAYTVMYVFSGILVDRWGTRRALSVFMVWWSASSVLHAFARNAWHLGLCRFLLGVGEPGNFMAAFRVVSEWYPPREKAFVNGLVNAGAAVGAVIAPPLVVWLLSLYGWRATFVVAGLLGFVWLAAWLFLYDVPERCRRITPGELALIGGAGPRGRRLTPWKNLLLSRTTWALLLPRFVSDPVWWFYLFWLPKYLVEKRGFTMAEIGLLGWIPYLSADIGSIGGGLLSGFLVKRGFPVIRARFAVMVPCALLMPLSIFVSVEPSPTMTLALICVITLAHMGWRANLSTLTNDLFPTHVVGSVSGIIAFGTGTGGALFTFLTGRIVEAHSYGPMFVLMGLLHPLALLIVWRLAPRRPPEDADFAAQPA